MGIELRGLSGKKVLITGAAKGQGFSHALAFADAGCDVALLDITHPVDPDMYDVATPAMMDAAVAAVEAKGRQAVPLPCDVRDEEQVKAAVAKALDAFGGRIDVLVNNAGMAALDTVHGMRSNVLHAVIDTNLKGAMLVTKYAVDNMIGRRAGKIINISSAVTGSGHAMLSHYVASKHGINGLTTSWAMELSEFNINVNCICPATVMPGEGQGSGMVLGLSKSMGMDPMEAFETFSSMGSMPGDKWRVEPRHITDAVLFLASDNAEMITGAIIPVDCGQMSR
jgi:(-)-trans-carveol dehydrogenase